MIYSNDQQLRLIGHRLLQEIKKNATEGKYVRFHPQTIEIISKSSIKFRAELTSNADLRGALRWLGVTLYHLATGRSEFTSPVLRNDSGAYKPFESELWPVISLLLSGEAFNLPDLERQLKSDNWLQVAVKKTAPIRNRLKSIVWMVCGFFGRLLSGCWQAILGICRKIYNELPVNLTVFALVLSVGVGFFYIYYFYTYFSGFRVIAIALVYILLSIFTFFINLECATNYTERSNNLGAAIFGLIFNVMLTALLMFFAFMSPKYLTDSRSTGVSNNPVLVSRSDGKFVSRFRQIDNDNLLAHQGFLFNLLKYKVVEGLPLAISTTLYLGKELNIIVNGKFTSEDKYLAAITKWPNEAALLLAVNEEIKKLDPKLKEISSVPVTTENTKAVPVGQLKVDWTGELDEKFKQEITETLQKSFDELLIQYGEKQLVLSKQPMILEIKTELMKVFGEYFDEIEVNIEGVTSK